jgi:hypothetical protein
VTLAHPEWTVIYGRHSRRFYAVVAWDAAEPVIVQAGTAGELLAEMRDRAATARLTGLIRDYLALAPSRAW